MKICRSLELKIAVALLVAALACTANAQSNTKTGVNAGVSFTTGTDNTADGYASLQSDTVGSRNVSIGSLSLQKNVSGNNNTAVGFASLKVSTGDNNTALGYAALIGNTSGAGNLAAGYTAMFANTSGGFNTGLGVQALRFNTTGASNFAGGYQALYTNTTGGFNVALGDGALYNNTTGSGNIGIGEDGGFNLTTGSNNISIGNKGVAGESGKIRIGTTGTHSEIFLAGVIRGNGSGLTGITSASLAANSVTSSQLANASVGSAKLVSGLTLAGTTTGTFSGNLIGNASTVSTVGGVTAANVASGANLANQATQANTANAIVRRDANMRFSINGLDLAVTTSATVGTLSQNGLPLLHTFGTDNFFAAGAGNFTLTGTKNVGIGRNVLVNNSTGTANTATGANALGANLTGNDNVAVGEGALVLSTSNSNIALGKGAGSTLTTGSNNIYIGNVNGAAADEIGKIRIGTNGVHVETTLTGLIRQGSGTGTADLPASGVITRRINSLSEGAGQIIARVANPQLTLERGDGYGDIILRFGKDVRFTVAATGIDSAGNTVNYYYTRNFDGPAGTMQIFEDFQSVVNFRLMFGNPRANADYASVELFRDDSDNYWVGTLTSSTNQ